MSSPYREPAAVELAPELKAAINPTARTVLALTLDLVGIMADAITAIDRRVDKLEAAEKTHAAAAKGGAR